MADIQLVTVVNNPIAVTFDWLTTPIGLLDETQSLATAVILALNTDAKASPTDVLPDPRSTNLRGWWGDLDAGPIWNGWPIGSKLWLLTRAKIVDNNAAEGATIVRVQSYIKDALQPFITNGLASQITVVAVQTDSKSIVATITIYRGSKAAVQLNYQPDWDEIYPPPVGSQ